MSCLTPERRVAEKEGCSGLGGKNLQTQNEAFAGACGGRCFILCLEIFYAEANRISLRHTLDYGKQLIHAYSTPERID